MIFSSLKKQRLCWKMSLHWLNSTDSSTVKRSSASREGNPIFYYSRDLVMGKTSSLIIFLRTNKGRATHCQPVNSISCQSSSPRFLNTSDVTQAFRTISCEQCFSCESIENLKFKNKAMSSSKYPEMLLLGLLVITLPLKREHNSFLVWNRNMPSLQQASASNSERMCIWFQPLHLEDRKYQILTVCLPKQPKVTFQGYVQWSC